MSREEEKVGLLLSETARAWRTRLDQRLRPLGLSQSKWVTLAHLANGGEKLTQSEIAARVGVEEPTLAGVLNRLQADGWIKRKNATHDGRCKVVHLQPRSKAVLAKIFATAQELRHELINDVPRRDLDTCVRVLKHIRDKAARGVKNGAAREAVSKRKRKDA